MEFSWITRTLWVEEQIKEFIKKSIMKNKVSHAYLINGEKGTGKQNIASLFAASLQCASPVDEWKDEMSTTDLAVNVFHVNTNGRWQSA